MSTAERREAQELGLEIGSVSLQQYVIRKTLDAGLSLGGTHQGTQGADSKNRTGVAR